VRGAGHGIDRRSHWAGRQARFPLRPSPQARGPAALDAISGALARNDASGPQPWLAEHGIDL
jgi:hypothetical protein